MRRCKVVIKRFIIEFWFAFLIAFAWATFRTWPFQAGWTSATSFIPNFSWAFFLASWLTGQFVRIARQQSTENLLGELHQKLSNVSEAVGQLVQRFADLAQRIIEKEPTLQLIRRSVRGLLVQTQINLRKTWLSVARIR